ncbi:MAG: molybdopterin-dependent oxidoreductase [Deltaproteobacteria bacterium]|nr:molybdopterin-dependent oxidoreductase [Deltaproteobacteria bacterium]
MDLTRRKFVKISAAGAAAAAVGPGVLKAMELDMGGKDTSHITKKMRKAVPYTCLQCNIEDGGIAYIEEGRIVKLEGNPKHPGNRGKLCAKGNAGINGQYDPDRILYPMKRVGKRGEGKWKRISWDEAYKELAQRITEVLDRADKGQGSPNEISIQIGRNRWFGFEDRFMHALGSDTVLNHTSICESSKKAGLEATWGPDIETPDFANTKYILNFGGNIYEASYFHNPYVQRIVEGRVDNHAKMVYFDPRMSNTAGKADEWFAIFPGTDGAVALAMCNVIMQNDLHNEAFINKWANYPADKLAKYLKQFTPEWAEKLSGVPAGDIERIAKEFALAAPRCTTYTYRGNVKHMNGSYNERCTTLLNIIVGNIEQKGGFCLPRGYGYKHPEPQPPKPKEGSELAHPHDYPLAHHKVSHHVAHMIKEGRQKVSVYMRHYHDGNYAHPDSDTWTDLYMDENLIPFHVSLDTFMSEATALSDLILPETTYLERFDIENMPSSIETPWVGIRQPVVKPLGECKSYRDIVLELMTKYVDPTGARGMKKYFEYGSTEDYLKYMAESVPGMKEAGGWDYLKKHGVWSPKPVDAEPEYGLHEEGGFWNESKKLNIYSHLWAKYGFHPLPHYEPIPAHENMKDDDLILITFKWNVHVQSRTANQKWLAEIVHNNPVWINGATAAKKGIKTGDLVRVTSKIGYMVTKAYVTEGINPKVVAISHSFGHKEYGRLASMKLKQKPQWSQSDDPDYKQVFWKDNGVHLNDIVPVSTDPIGGSQGWFDTVVSVEKAKPGDKYKDIKVDKDAARKAYEETLTYSYIGKNFRRRSEGRGEHGAVSAH